MRTMNSLLSRYAQLANIYEADDLRQRQHLLILAKKEY
jgi:hypothetical protein